MKYILFWKECEASLVTERTFFSKVNFPCREMNRSIPNGQVNRSNCLPAWKPAAPNSDSPPHLHMCWRLVTTLRIVPASPEFQFKPSGVALWFSLLAIARCDYPLVVASYPTAKCNFFFFLSLQPHCRATLADQFISVSQAAAPCAAFQLEGTTDFKLHFSAWISVS